MGLMKDYKELSSDRPGDDEKRMIVTLAKALAKATDKKPAEVYDEALPAVEKLRKRHMLEFLKRKHPDILG